jgi:hypothetical protein
VAALNPNLFPIFLSLPSAHGLCSKLGGRIPFPRNIAEHGRLVSMKSNFTETCYNMFWIPIQRSKANSTRWMQLGKNGQVTDVTDLLAWASGEPNGELIGEDCVMSYTWYNSYQDWSCSTLACFYCQFEKQVKLAFFNSSFRKIVYSKELFLHFSFH